MTLRDGKQERIAWGRKLAKLRKAKGYSNAPALAAEVGVSKRTVEHWEGGQHWPEAPHLAQLVRVLGPEVDPGSLIQLGRIEAKLDEIQSAVNLLGGRMDDVTGRLRGGRDDPQ